MQEIISIIKEKLKHIDNTAYSGKYKEGYSDALSDVIEIMEKNIRNILFLGGIYYLISYEKGDKNYPYIEKVLLSKIVETENRIVYHFTRDLDVKNLYFAKSDIVIGYYRDILNRVFVTRETAEKKLGGEI